MLVQPLDQQHQAQVVAAPSLSCLEGVLLWCYHSTTCDWGRCEMGQENPRYGTMGHNYNMYNKVLPEQHGLMLCTLYYNVVPSTVCILYHVCGAGATYMGPC
jgi:hypothetical protein